MPELSTDDREKVRRGLARYWSNIWELCTLSKADLRAAVNATDVWIDDNAVSYNQALPSEAQSGLTGLQKTLLFCAVALMRIDPGIALLLRRALAVEVN